MRSRRGVYLISINDKHKPIKIEPIRSIDDAVYIFGVTLGGIATLTTIIIVCLTWQ